jgi:hypothetical protein
MPANDCVLCPHAKHQLQNRQYSSVLLLDQQNILRAAGRILLLVVVGLDILLEAYCFWLLPESTDRRRSSRSGLLFVYINDEITAPSQNPNHQKAQFDNLRVGVVLIHIQP